jgi:hypothetical protein
MESGQERPIDSLREIHVGTRRYRLKIDSRTPVVIFIPDLDRPGKRDLTSINSNPNPKTHWSPTWDSFASSLSCPWQIEAEFTSLAIAIILIFAMAVSCLVDLRAVALKIGISPLTIVSDVTLSHSYCRDSIVKSSLQCQDTSTGLKIRNIQWQFHLLVDMDLRLGCIMQGASLLRRRLFELRGQKPVTERQSWKHVRALLGLITGTLSILILDGIPANSAF